MLNTGAKDLGLSPEFATYNFPETKEYLSLKCFASSSLESKEEMEKITLCFYGNNSLCVL